MVNRRTLSVAGAGVAVALLIGGCSAGEPTSVSTLDGITVVSDEPAGTSGYDRACGTGHGCVFGPAWSDDVSVRLGHNGCDTRNDILREQLSDPAFKPGTHGCVVISGTLLDSYTGQTVSFTKAMASQVQIDHIYPLALAWNRGAADWSAEHRRDFANDPDNLTATIGSANQSKSDKSPAQWLPSYQPGRCAYAASFIKLARKYQLPITAADARALNDTTAACK